MAADNVKTAFRLPIGVNEDFITNLIWQHHQQQQYQKDNINQQQQNIKQLTRRCFEIYTGKDLCWSLFLIKFQVFSLQLYQKRDSDTGIFLWTYYEHAFLSNTSGRLLLEDPKILLETVPIAIPNDISKGYYQNGFVICFLRSTCGRFMEFLIETCNKGFSCSWIFSASLALPNA